MTLTFLPPTLRSVLTTPVVVFGATVLILAKMLPALVKLLTLVEAAGRTCVRVLTALALAWVATNNAWMTAVSAGTRARH